MAKIPNEIYSKFNKNELLEAEIIKTSPSLNSLFNEFKFKKCDEIFMNLELNPQMFDKCKDIVLEREKMISDIDKDYLNLKSKENIFKKYMTIYSHNLVNFFKLSNNQFYLLSGIIFLIAMVVVISPFYK